MLMFCANLGLSLPPSLLLTFSNGLTDLQIKRLIGSKPETLGIAERFLAGSLAGVIAQSSIYPMEVRVHC